MRNYSLLDRAKKDVWNARLVFKHWDGDELSYDIAAYHVQQAIEKSMKYVLSQNKVEFKKQHDAVFLKEQFEDNNIDLPVWFAPNMDVLDRFVTLDIRHARHIKKGVVSVFHHSPFLFVQCKRKRNF